MSYQAVAWAFRDAPMLRNAGRGNDTAARLVLAALADAADDDGTNAFLARSTIEFRTGLSESGVKRGLKALEQAGLIARTGVVGDGVINWALRLDHRRPESERREHDSLVSARLEAARERMAARRQAASHGDESPVRETSDRVPFGHPDLNVQVRVTERSGQGEPHTSPSLTHDQFSPPDGEPPLTRRPAVANDAIDREPSSAVRPSSVEAKDGLEEKQAATPVPSPASGDHVGDWRDDLADADSPQAPSLLRPKGINMAQAGGLVADHWRSFSPALKNRFRGNELQRLVHAASTRQPEAVKEFLALKLPSPFVEAVLPALAS